VLPKPGGSVMALSGPHAGVRGTLLAIDEKKFQAQVRGHCDCVGVLYSYRIGLLGSNTNAADASTAFFMVTILHRSTAYPSY